jgi:hypothetical protein
LLIEPFGGNRIPETVWRELLNEVGVFKALKIGDFIANIL